MKPFAEKPGLPINSLTNPVTGQKWTLKEKIFLGLSPGEYVAQMMKNPVNWILAVIFAIGIPLIIQRYFHGLASVTHSSYDYPWGLFLGFGLFGMVPLSASGFMLGTSVEVFGRHDFHPIERLALLNGLLGYFFAVIYLLVDLGSPWRLIYPMFVSLGPAAVLFLVAWHVATYLSVQIAEVSPAFFEWMGWSAPKRFIRSIILGLTIAGIILSTLHQGALGALFTYAPGKLHPLWYSGFLWIYFLCSSIAAGLGMVITVSTICKWTMKWRADREFLDNLDSLTLGLAKGAAFAHITYLIIKIVGVAHDNEWAYLLTGWGAYFVFELTVHALIPLILFTIAIQRQNASIARFAALLTVLGTVFNRINTALVAFNWKMYQEIPHWKEVFIVITVFAIYFITYRFILYRWPVIYSWKDKV